MTTEDRIKFVVREKYAQAAVAARSGGGGCCSNASSCCDPITSNLYGPEAEDVPGLALQASLGCGNPTVLADLQPGDVVLDLGSGGGIDVLLSARRVGPEGKVYGLDMTDEMLALAEENKRKSGLANVAFLKGDIEAIPLPDACVDVVISNCVINLAADKDKVLREAFRVLKPGGRFAVSDIVVRGDVPAALRKSMALWAGCIAGALADDDYVARLEAAGFVAATIEPTRIYSAADAAQFLAGEDEDASAGRDVEGKLMSAFIRARKPSGPAGSEGVTRRVANG